MLTYDDRLIVECGDCGVILLEGHVGRWTALCKCGGCSCGLRVWRVVCGGKRSRVDSRPKEACMLAGGLAAGLPTGWVPGRARLPTVPLGDAYACAKTRLQRCRTRISVREVEQWSKRRDVDVDVGVDFGVGVDET